MRYYDWPAYGIVQSAGHAGSLSWWGYVGAYSYSYEYN
jgi:hypothetical protein